MGTTPENLDQAEGRLKQATGDLIGDDDLQREGEIDETKGDVKEAIDNASEKVKGVVDDVRSRLSS